MLQQACRTFAEFRIEPGFRSDERPAGCPGRGCTLAAQRCRHLAMTGAVSSMNGCQRSICLRRFGFRASGHCKQDINVLFRVASSMPDRQEKDMLGIDSQVYQMTGAQIPMTRCRSWSHLPRLSSDPMFELNTSGTRLDVQCQRQHADVNLDTESHMDL